jgi:methylmalonyl-CoA mutase N-terminal domain/subunit
MRERFHAKKPESWKLRFHTQTAGCSLTQQQPQINVVRVTLQALAAVLGGTQSLHTNSMDEVMSLPTEESVTIALRTQQIIAEESGVPNTIDPLGGSYFVESLTNQMEAEALHYISTIDEMGGIVKAIEAGYPQRLIAEAAYRYQQQIESGDKVIVGMNKYLAEEEYPIELLRIGDEVERGQIAGLKKLRAERDNQAVNKYLDQLKNAARGRDNLMPIIINAVRNYASVGEICDVLREVFGEYREQAIY